MVMDSSQNEPKIEPKKEPINYPRLNLFGESEMDESKSTQRNSSFLGD